VILRREWSSAAPFGCSINPRAENLASVQDFLRESAGQSLKPAQREAWIAELRRRLGLQDIAVFGVDPRSHAARVLVEADYHMKLIGIGLEPGTVGVSSYLASISPPAGDSPPPLDVLRWWFTMNYDAPRATPEMDAVELVGPGVKVLSENELLAERGERVHTGTSSPWNQQFAANFTRHFADLAVKYPVYAELRNLFDLALATAMIRQEELAGRCDWQPTFFAPGGQYETEHDTAPRHVESIVNHRLIERRHLVVGVSGGVSADARAILLVQPARADNYGALSAEHAGAAPPQLSARAWWWD
jgi:hypothetical protein